MIISEIEIVFILLVPIGITGREAVRILDPGRESFLNVQLAQNNASVPPSEAQENLHSKCVEAERRAEQQAAEMVPGRTWTWALDAERSLQQLDELRHDLTALRESEAAFEGSLTPDQISKYQTQIRAMNQLSQHLAGDVQSLDDELRKGHPRRWHVADDARDMQKEIQHWRRFHDVVWAGLSKLRERTGTL